DPGIGFGKRLEDNLALLARLGELRALGRPILLGVSRKSFIGHVTGAQAEHDPLAHERRDRPSDRIGGTAAAIALAASEGSADIYRVHDVRVMVEALAVARAIAGARA
ncbi:MAG: dihydropteroate synthase, partial [Planctomycetota bacterium]